MWGTRGRGFFVDIHNYTGTSQNIKPKGGVFIKDQGYYDIPYRCFLPRGVENLLVAGRSLSATHEAHASARVTSGGASGIRGRCGARHSQLHGHLTEHQAQGRRIKDQGYYDIPYRCFLPRGVENLLVAGRSLSATHEAHASARVMGTCMGMGHAVGAAAAMAVQGGMTPRQLDVQRLQQELLDQGAYLGAREVVPA